MFAPGCGARFQAVQNAAIAHAMHCAGEAGDTGAQFDFALALILPHLRAHLSQQSEICRVIR